MPDEDRLSMLGRRTAESRAAAAAGVPTQARFARRRALAACAVIVLALHAAFIDGIGGVVPGAAPDSGLAPMSVRTVPDEHEPAESAEAPAVAAPADPVPGAAPLRARPLRRLREPAVASSQPEVMIREEASANSDASLRPVEETAIEPPVVLAVDVPLVTRRAVEPAASIPADAAETLVAAASPRAAAPLPPTLLAAGEEPPPLYRTQLPPSATLHYQVRRGILRGTGEIRWQASGDRYRLVLEAQVAGLTLLTQTSEGGIDANGLAPVRFLDRRARRPAQAANFRRDDGRITFSGVGVEWPLLAGSQDRLSWMIQLAGIAAAEPERLVEGGRITMVVVGARGDAGIWSLRVAGRETVETAFGPVHAVKLVREGRSAYDTSAEIWLDPERSYLPAHATLRNSAGVSEYDLLLERVDPG